MEDSVTAHLKLVIVGDSGSGKTNLISRFTRDYFEEGTGNTIGIDFMSVDLNISDKKIKIQIYDTAGQEKYRSIAKSYYNKANGIIIVYDITKKESLLNIENWIKDLDKYVDSDFLVLLIGNKIDLQDLRRVPFEEGSLLAQKKGYFFMETSAKTNENDCVKI